MINSISFGLTIHLTGLVICLKLLPLCVALSLCLVFAIWYYFLVLGLIKTKIQFVVFGPFFY